MAPPIKAAEFDGDFTPFVDSYTYQPKLTPRLDSPRETEFTQELVNEIVLWKVNRFVEIDGGLLQDLEGVRKLTPGKHREAAGLLAALLEVHGVDLSMASTFLRFRNPSVFQIIDRHAYRALYGSGFPKTPVAERKIKCYFDYLDELLKLCDLKVLKFETVDRVLYEFDRAKNGKLKSEGRNVEHIEPDGN